MGLHKQITDLLTNHKSKIEMIQWAIISGISSLIYCEFLRNMQHNLIPTQKVFIPEIKQVQELLSIENNLYKLLENNFVKRIKENELFKQYQHCLELEIFNEEILEILFTLYIYPNLEKNLPKTFQLKFGIGNPENQTFFEKPDLDLFNRQDLHSDHIKYMADQTVLQLLCNLPTIGKDIHHIRSNEYFIMDKNEIFILQHENELTPLYFDENIIQNYKVINLLSFVTSTEFNPANDIYEIKSNPYNKIAIITLSENNNTETN